MIPLGFDRTNNAIRSKINFKVEVCSAHYDSHSSKLGWHFVLFIFTFAQDSFFFLFIYRIHTSSTPLIVIVEIHTICDLVTHYMPYYVEHTVQDVGYESASLNVQTQSDRRLVNVFRMSI